MARTAEEQRNLDLVLSMYNEVLVPFDSSKVDRYISPEYVQHSSLAPPGRAALKEFLDFIRQRSPDAQDAHQAQLRRWRPCHLPCARDPPSG
ncbi:MAG: hypothetical protein WDO12_05835 [Pseudomonadota bacterium]